MPKQFLEFIVSVVSLHFALLSGCVLTVLVGLYERFVAKREINPQQYATVIAALLFFSCFQAWQYERLSRVGRETDLHRQEGLTISAEGREQSCLVSLRVAQDSLNRNSGAMDAKGSQIASQQSSLDNCLVQLGKAQLVEAQRITAHMLRSEPTKKTVVTQDRQQQKIEMFERKYVVLTNRPLTPIRLGVSCPGRLLWLARGEVMGTGAMTVGGWGGRMSVNLYGVGILSPAWTPINPLLVTITAIDDPTQCQFNVM